MTDSHGMQKCQIQDSNQHLPTSMYSSSTNCIFHRIFWVMALWYTDRLLEFGTNYNKSGFEIMIKKSALYSNRMHERDLEMQGRGKNTKKSLYIPFIQSSINCCSSQEEEGRQLFFFSMCTTHMQFVTQHLAFYGVTLSVTTVTLNEGVQ